MRWFLVRLVISAGLLAWLLHRIDLGRIAGNLAHANVGWVIAANVLTAPVIVLISWKWQILLRALGARERLWWLVRMNLVGGFYSLILPGEETGQLAKGIIMARHSEGDAVAASIVVDEILGTISIFTIALVALAATHPFPLRFVLIAAIGFMMAVFLALLALALTKRLHDVAFHVAGRFKGPAAAVAAAPARLGGRQRGQAAEARVLAWLDSFGAWLAPFRSRLALYHRRPWHLLSAFAITVVAHLVAAASVYGTMHAVGANLSFVDVCWVVAAISALVTIPITVSGFGVREGANVVILGQLGVSPSTALAVSLLSFAIGFIWSLPGGLLQFGLKRPSGAELEAGRLGSHAPRPEMAPAVEAAQH